MHIGIVSFCDISVFEKHLYQESREKIVYRKNFAPAVNNLILGLWNAGHKISVFTTHPINEDEIVLYGDRLTFYIVPSYEKYPWKFLHGCWIDAMRLKKCLEKRVDTLDVLHSHWTYEFAWAAGSFSSQLPVACTIRDWAPTIWRMQTLKNKITWFFRWMIFRQVLSNKKIHFIANSEYIATLVHKRNKWKVEVIENSIRDEFFRKRHPIKEGEDVFEIITIAMFNDKHKNIVNLLLAYRIFRPKFPNSRLVLIGPSFTADNAAVRQWQSLGYLDNVVLKGSVRHSELPEILEEASLMVHPSLEESFGNTLLEAMACGIPVIAGKYSGAVPFVLDGGNTGCLCDVSNPNEIAAAIERVYFDIEYRTQIINNASTWVKRFKLERVIEYHTNFYKRIMKTCDH